MEVITTHTNADFDTLASMLAAKKLYPDAHLVFPGSQERGVREFLLKSSLIIDPRRSSMLKDSLINTFQLERVKDIDISEIKRLILVDIREASRIGRFKEILDKPDLDIHIYDHHPSGPDDIHGDVEYTLPYGSTTTILTHILKERGIKISPEEATVMLLGIYEDTGSLTYPSTTEKDFEAAAFLLAKGGDLSMVSEILSKELTIDDISILNELITSATTYSIEGVDITITQAVVEQHIGDIALLVHKIIDICNMDVVFAMIMMEDKIHLVARSRLKDVDVGEVAKEFGGGGHPTAASATIKDMTLVDVKERLIAVLRDRIRPQIRAGEIMSYQPITVNFDDTIKDARDILTRYNISALPVMKSGEVVGIITRQVVEKAVYHKLETIPVEEYMTIEFERVDKDAPLSRVQEIIIEHNQRLLPVVHKSKLLGLITRTDLLRSLHEVTIREKPYLEREKRSPRKKNIKRLIQERLPDRVFKMLRDIGRVADEIDFKAYVVGGFVRDILLRNENLDVDIVIEGDGIVFARKFAEEFSCRVRSHKRFSTAVIIFPDGFKVDVATARLEYYKRPGALPTVEKSSIKLDLYRRDFTINTLAVSLNPHNFGELLDFYGGLKDIKEKTLRVIHNLSFVEDPTRILRAIRFEQRFGFTLGKHTLKLIKNTIKLDLFKFITKNRLFVEFQAILKEDRAIDILNRLNEIGILRAIDPRITIDKDEKVLERTRDTLSWFRLLYLDENVEEWLVIFLSLTDNLNQEELVNLSMMFGITGKHNWLVIKTRERAINALHELHRNCLSPSDIYRILIHLPMETLLYLMARTKKEEVRKSISHFVTHLRYYRPKLSGRDLISLGIPEGPVYGEILDRLLAKGLNGELKTREEEISYVKAFIGKRGGRFATASLQK